MPSLRVIVALLLALVAIACQADGQSQAPARHGSKALYDSDDPAIVKKSRGGICYESSDGRFAGIYHYTAYANMDDCLAEGGRLPSD
ncbi:MAG: hypothetical protein HW417_218 [Steroidobacteraceae bacterium]|nr:hypothetical protein [Steroidobacteraceae bacterium]